MLAGTAEARTLQPGFVNLYRCYDSYDSNMFFQPNPMGVAASDTYSLPTKYCAGGIRVNTFFPTYVTPLPCLILAVFLGIWKLM
jgi:hypothetical protein